MSIYLDNAATSWPKPKTVIKEMKKFFDRCGGNPGRTGRERVILSRNAAEIINTVLSGFLDCGDHLNPAYVEDTAEQNSPLPEKY